MSQIGRGSLNFKLAIGEMNFNLFIVTFKPKRAGGGRNPPAATLKARCLACDEVGIV